MQQFKLAKIFKWTGKTKHTSKDKFPSQKCPNELEQTYSKRG